MGKIAIFAESLGLALVHVGINRGFQGVERSSLSPSVGDYVGERGLIWTRELGGSIGSLPLQQKREMQGDCL